MKQLALEALDAALRHGVGYADARAIESWERDLSTKNGKPGQISSSESAGLGIRVLADGCWGFAATDDLSKAGVEAAARLAVAIARSSAYQRRHRASERSARHDPHRLQRYLESDQQRLRRARSRAAADRRSAPAANSRTPRSQCGAVRRSHAARPNRRRVRRADESRCAEDLANYSIVPLNLRGQVVGKPVRIRSATYDPTTNSVTLVPYVHLNVYQYFRLTVNGSAPNGLTDVQGNFLSGAGVNNPGTNFVSIFGRDLNVLFFDHQGNLDTLGFRNGKPVFIVLEAHVAPPIGLSVKSVHGASHPKFVHESAFVGSAVRSAAPAHPSSIAVALPTTKHQRRRR